MGRRQMWWGRYDLVLVVFLYLVASECIGCVWYCFNLVFMSLCLLAASHNSSHFQVLILPSNLLSAGVNFKSSKEIDNYFRSSKFTQPEIIDLFNNLSTLLSNVTDYQSTSLSQDQFKDCEFIFNRLISSISKTSEQENGFVHFRSLFCNLSKEDKRKLVKIN